DDRAPATRGGGGPDAVVERPVLRGDRDGAVAGQRRRQLRRRRDLAAVGQRPRADRPARRIAALRKDARRQRGRARSRAAAAAVVGVAARAVLAGALAPGRARHAGLVERTVGERLRGDDLVVDAVDEEVALLRVDEERED